MIDLRIQKMAEVLIRYSTEVKKGERLSLVGTPENAPLLEALYVEGLKAGAHVEVDLGLTGMGRKFFLHAQEHQLGYVSEHRKLQMENTDVMIQLLAEQNPYFLSGVDPEKQKIHAQGTADLARRPMERLSDGSLRVCATTYPTLHYAIAAHMALDAYEDFVFSACYLEDDPVARWKAISKHQQRIIDSFEGVRRIHLEAPGTDLRFSVEGRSWMNCDGHANFPDGEVYTCPVEDSVEGHVSFTYPACLPFSGEEAENVHLVFEKGRAVEARASYGQDFLQRKLDTDEGARFLGEFAIGTNPMIRRFSRNLLFDEKIGGTCHLALGASAPGCGGKNVSAIHWDMVCDLREGRITMDDRVVYAEGDFVDDGLKIFS